MTGIAAAVCLISALSCSDLEDFEKRIDSLEARLDALETIIPKLNSNLEAIQALSEKRMINEVIYDEASRKYTLTLTDGEVITLEQGSIGTANPPKMSIDNEGYWMADYGQGAEPVLCSGEKVKATGDAGITPLIGVNDKGEWTVSYDNGKTYEILKDSEGAPVVAVPDKESKGYFEDVHFDGTSLKIKLTGSSETLSVPVVPDFLISIGDVSGAEKDEDGTYILNAGTNYQAELTVKGVKSIAVISKPSGVEASVDSENSLLILRATGTGSKAIADSRRDLALLAISENSLSAIAKIQVKVEGDSGSVNDTAPAAFITLVKEATTENTLTYRIVLENSSEYRYIIRKSGEDAPSEADFSALESSDKTELTISGLDSATEYTLYILPSGTEPGAEIATYTSTTASPLPPTAEVTAPQEQGFNSLTFTVEHHRAEKLTYILLASDLSAPTKETIISGGTEITVAEGETTTEINIGDLNPETGYIIYVVPVSPTSAGEIATAESTTRAVNKENPYEVYITGGDIIIGGMTINRTSFSTATLITASSASKDKDMKNNGLYFIEPDVENVTMNSGKSIVAIGTDPAKRSLIARKNYSFIPSGTDNDYWVLSNIELNAASTNAGYMFQITGDAVCETIIIDNCSIGIPASTSFIYANSSNIAGSILIKDSEFLVGEGNTNNFLNFAAEKTVSAITFDNNVFYSADPARPATCLALISGSKTTVQNLTMNRNTFYGAMGNSKTPLTNCLSNSCTITGNMFTVQEIAGGNVNLVNGKISATMNITNNRCHIDNTNSYRIGGVGSSLQAPEGTAEQPGKRNPTGSDWNPAEGRFILDKDFGATR